MKNICVCVCVCISRELVLIITKKKKVQQGIQDDTESWHETGAVYHMITSTNPVQAWCDWKIL